MAPVARRAIFAVVFHHFSIAAGSAPVEAGGLSGDLDISLAQAWTEHGDAASFARLVERHQPYVRRVAVLALGRGHEADADDVTQEVFVRVARRLDRFRGDSCLRTWLHRLARNCALDRRRSARGRAIHLDLSVLDRRPAGSSEDVPFWGLEAAERRRVVHECLDELPDRLRELLRLHYWQELSVEEIAHLVRRPPATVRSSLYRGRRRLFRAITGRGLGPH